ncbi:PLP-dependent aminotransferase family protein [Burkholderia sp. A1]|uniref:aminotransferase-like domain-containing protein n=1 Tax=Burkholderia sp. A1 TaxID=148446 RepID=UPI000A70CDE2
MNDRDADKKRAAFPADITAVFLHQVFAQALLEAMYTSQQPHQSVCTKIANSRVMKSTPHAAKGASKSGQLATEIKRKIRSGTLLPGTRLPSIRQLAVSHHVSRFCVVEAYERLVAQGLVRSRHGSGFYVADDPEESRTKQTSNQSTLATEASLQILQQFNPGGPMLKLSSGFVPESWRDVDGIAKAIGIARRDNAENLTDYAAPEGMFKLRQALLDRARRVGLRANLPNIMVTNGASQALDLVVRSELRPGDTVFVEDPGYYNLFGLLKLQHVNLVAIPRTEEGPDLDTLESLLKSTRPKLLFINTVFHNPTGSTLAPPVAFRLLQLAHSHDFTIVEDDVYADLQAEPSQRMAALDNLDRVIYISGLSKTLSSSLRIGYMIANPRRIREMVNVKVLTSLGGNRLAEAVAAAAIERGTYSRHLLQLQRRMHRALAATLRTLSDAGWCVFGSPDGGSFIWARVPGIDDSRILVQHASECGITLAPGASCRPSAQPTPWVRINVAFAQDPRALIFFQRMGQAKA